MFVQIGDKKAFNPDLVTEVYLHVTNANQPTTTIYFDTSDGEEQAWMGFVGDDRAGFLRWWEEKAEVYRVT